MQLTLRNTSSVLACWHCGRAITGKVKHVGSSTWVPDFPKAYHPDCYAAADREAYRELHRNSRRTR